MRKSTYIAIAVFLIAILVFSLKGFDLRFSGVDYMALHVEGKYIKNASGQVIILRGVNKPTFEDDPDGIWMGNTMWSDTRVKTELDEMRKWGINVVRVHLAVELTKYDIGPNSQHPASSYCAISAREALHRLIQFAAEKGIYVILDGYSVTCYWCGGQQDQLPYPPYQSSENAEQVIGNVQDFVDWWRIMASEYKQYSNVLFEPWNEPRGNSTAFDSWLNAFQQCVNAIREEGFTGIIIFNWGWGVYCNINANDQDFPIGHPKWGETLRDWLETAANSINDPMKNLVFDVHRYRSGGDSGILDTSLREYWGDNYAYNYTQIKMAMEYMGFKWAGDEVGVPLIVGEHGCNLAFTDEKLEHELIAFHNDLQIFNEWGIGYIEYCWREGGIYRLLTSPTQFTPSESGKIFKTWLQSGSLQDAGNPHVLFASHIIEGLNYTALRLTFDVNVKNEEIARVAVKGNGEPPGSVQINGLSYQPKSSMVDFNNTKEDCWFYDSEKDLIWVKVTGSVVQIDWEAPSESEPQLSPPTNGAVPENQTSTGEQTPNLTSPPNEFKIVIITTIIGVAVIAIWWKKR